jgi:hypothetical protein
MSFSAWSHEAGGGVEDLFRLAAAAKGGITVRSGTEFRTIEGVRPGVTASRWCLGIELLGLIIGLVNGEGLVRVPSGRKAPCALGVVLAMLPKVKKCECLRQCLVFNAGPGMWMAADSDQSCV